MKALDMVRGVLRLRTVARRGEVRDGLARRATLRIVKATTGVAKRMRQLPLPKPGPEERLALGVAATQLRAMLEVTPLREEAERDPTSPEAALTELVAETLALVDAMMATDPELAAAEAPKGQLPAAEPEGGVIKVKF
jgi:hypothetical protein